MFQLIAISAAVGDELTRKGWWPPRNLNAKMGKDYHYDSDSFSTFLISVRHRLETSISEAYTFSFDATFAEKGLSMPISELIGALDEMTISVARPHMLNAAFAINEAFVADAVPRSRIRSTPGNAAVKGVRTALGKGRRSSKDRSRPASPTQD